ncbi:MAG TPA: serine--tRNA ligase [Kofleriaceae bacterium]|nr:serine--tRNA ligase [Kofleriaceae bacterium]
MDDVVRRAPEVATLVAAWRSADERRRKLQGDLDSLRQQRNAANETMAKLDKKSPEFVTAREGMKALAGKIKDGEAELTRLEADCDQQLLLIPNAPHPSVPSGAGEADNPVLHTWGEKPVFGFTPKPHDDLGRALGVLDFEGGVRIAGTRFTVLRGAASRLNRALLNYMLDLHTRHGYEEAWPPAIVRRASLVGTGQLPKLAEDMFRLEMSVGPDHVADNDLFLSPTSEVQITNLHADQILDVESLPRKFCAYAACFRSEAGAAGRDTRGLIRQHQFDKIELVKLVAPETSYDELDAMRADAERVLQGLGLHYRVVTLCTGDLGFTAAKTYDLEVWLPGQDAYREISSCSNCEDFQARRAKIRYRRSAGDKPRHVHTLNGSGLPLGRTLVAIFEQCQQADGSILIPQVLRPYMGGLERIAAAGA